ncbi:MAG TPA: exodeoxyribonuclease V subunit alpha [Janthinobacterium sp.]|nr:exodeoxyribonuclease V subunit alpha [Janthinobacterium sp.]
MRKDTNVNTAALLDYVDGLAEAGQLRRLSGAFARFIGSLGAAAPALLLACAILSELEGRGHSCLMLDQLVGDPASLMGWSDEEWRALLAAAGPLPKTPAGWRALLAESEQVWRAGDLDFGQPMVLDGERLYLRRYWRDETLVAQAVAARAAAARTPDADLVRAWLDILFDKPSADGGPDWQKIACAIALRGRVAIITGGPGTGKTYTVASLLTLLFAVQPDPLRLRVALAAPTGKAAARLKQSIDGALASLSAKAGAGLGLLKLAERMGAARTLHSLLGARPDTRSFLHHAGNPLDVDVLIVDEASMVHLEMMAALLDALPRDAMLILLGDKDQLASVEAGAVLGDLCREAQAGGYSEETLAYALAAAGVAIPAMFQGAAGALAQQTVMLRHSHRFGGPIGALAAAVNAGDGAAALACLRGDSGGKVDWIEPGRQTDVLPLALSGRAGAGGGYLPYLKLLREGGEGRVHEAWVRAVLRSFESFRILCAVRDGEWGVGGLNAAIEERLEKEGWIRRGEWYVGRPVMVTRNDYATGVFNGDIGLTLRDPERPASLRVYFMEGEAVRSVLATRLRHVETAYAMTVHKSQGSEFRHTVLVLPKEGGAMLARELIYTGITRARDFFTLVTPAPSVLAESIQRRTHRASGLHGRFSKTP